MPPAHSFFDILGVPRRYHLGEAELERAFHERSRALHPDRHVKADPQTRVKNALASSQLNEAWRTLKQRIPRAEYLLKLEGIDISDERSGHKVDPAFLAEMLELREALSDARAEDDAVKVAELGRQVAARREAELARIDEGFARWEAGEPHASGGREAPPSADDRSQRAALTEVADALVAERYLRRFLEEVETFEEARL